MDKEEAERLVDYAIKRINMYDSLDGNAELYKVFHKLPKCHGCDLTNHDCNSCPFGMRVRNSKIGHCRGHLKAHTRVKTHQKALIRALKQFCKRFIPEIEIEEL